MLNGQRVQGMVSGQFFIAQRRALNLGISKQCGPQRLVAQLAQAMPRATQTSLRQHTVRKHYVLAATHQQHLPHQRLLMLANL